MLGFKKKPTPTPTPKIPITVNQTTVIGPPPPPPPSPLPMIEINGFPKTFNPEDLSFEKQYSNALEELGLKFLLASDNLDEWYFDTPQQTLPDCKRRIIKNNIFTVTLNHYNWSSTGMIDLAFDADTHTFKNYNWSANSIPTDLNDPYINAYFNIVGYLLRSEREQKFSEKLRDLQNILGNI